MTSQDIDSLDEILDCNVTGPDATLECVRGTPCKHIRADLLKWRDEQVVEARRDELQKIADNTADMLAGEAWKSWAFRVSDYLQARAKQLEAE